MGRLPTPLILTFLGMILMAEGYKTVNEVCTRSSTNPSDPRNCDPMRYLICGSTSLCSCRYNTIWQRQMDKCTFPVKGICTDAFGSPGWPGNGDGHQGGNGPSPGCPMNADCDARGTGKCECREGYEPNDDMSECNGGSVIRNTLSTSFGLILCYLIASKMFA